jgi:hypothetical protein
LRSQRREPDLAESAHQSNYFVSIRGREEVVPIRADLAIHADDQQSE